MINLTNPQNRIRKKRHEKETVGEKIYIHIYLASSHQRHSQHCAMACDGHHKSYYGRAGRRVSTRMNKHRPFQHHRPSGTIYIVGNKRTCF